MPACVVTNPALADAVVAFAAPGLSAAGVGGAAAATGVTAAAAASAVPAVLASAGGILGGLGGLGTAIATSAAGGVVGTTVVDNIINPGPGPSYLAPSGGPSFVDETITNERDLGTIAGGRIASLSAVPAGRGGRNRVLRAGSQDLVPGRLRLNPMFAIIGRGTRRAFKVEAQDRDGKWRDVTNSPNTSLSFGDRTGAFAQHRAVRNMVGVPINVNPALDGSRVRIQATYQTPDGQRLEAQGVGIASVHE